MTLARNIRAALLLSIILPAALSACGRESAAPANEAPSGASLQPAIMEETMISETSAPPSRLPDFGPAPELRNDVWLNSNPLRLADLQGKVVLLEFWTFGCINCQRVIPYMREWHERYAGDDFIVVTIHYPEFSYEEDIDNVREALIRNEIEYAVAIDNEGLTWRAYGQRYWPTRYLIDRGGHIRYKHIGEGGYDETDAAIRQLLAETPGS